MTAPFLAALLWGFLCIPMGLYMFIGGLTDSLDLLATMFDIGDEGVGRFRFAVAYAGLLLFLSSLRDIYFAHAATNHEAGKKLEKTFQRHEDRTRRRFFGNEDGATASRTESVEEK